MTAHSPGRIHWAMLLKKIQQQVSSTGKCTVLQCKKWFVGEGMSREDRWKCGSEVETALGSLVQSKRIEIVLGAHQGNPTRIILVKKSETTKTTHKAVANAESDKSSFGIPGL